VIAVNVGVIGCGRIATLVHLPCLQKLKDCEIAAIADVHPRYLNEAMKKFGVDESYTDYKDMLKKADIDTVVICTPPEHHFQIAFDSIEHEKHVLCEKPIAVTTKEASTIKKALEAKQRKFEHNLVFMPAHNFVFTPCFQKAQEIINRGEIGKVLRINGCALSNLRFYKPKTDFRLQAKGGVIEDQLPHLLYLLHEIAGPVKKVSNVEFRSKNGVINNVFVEGELVNGVHINMSAGWSGFLPTLTLDVVGEHGKIMMDLLRTPYNLKVIKNGEAETINMGRRIRQYIDVLRFKHPSYEIEHLHFSDCVKKEKEPQVSVDDGVELVRAVNEVLTHFEEDRLSSRSEGVVVLRIEKSVQETVGKSVRMLGGLMIKRDDLVVVKPNVCYPKNVENMIITDLRVLETVLNLVRRKTKNVLVVESDSFSGTAEKRMINTGTMEIVKKCGVDFLNLSRDDIEEHEVAGFALEIPKTVLKADFLVNLPKLKTHDFMYVSLAMKNMFGILANKKKSKLHKALTEVLVYLNRVVRQDLIIVDGIVGMEGIGPITGSPVHLGLIISGLNPVTVDAVCCHIMGINPYVVEPLWKAYKTGIGEIDIKRIRVFGETIDNVKRKFRLPSRSPQNIFTALKTSLKVYLKR
jgi:predicted dehydrogenase